MEKTPKNVSLYSNRITNRSLLKLVNDEKSRRRTWRMLRVEVNKHKLNKQMRKLGKVINYDLSSCVFISLLPNLYFVFFLFHF